MADLAQLAFAGCAQGAVYALLALGFVTIHSVTGVINLAQGEFAVLGGFLAISAVGLGLPLPVAAAVAIVAVAAAAILVERLTIRPVRRMTTMTSIIITLGVSTALKAAMLLVWGAEGQALTRFPGPERFMFAGISIRTQELWILGIGIIAAGVMWWLSEATLAGKALRACAEQPVAARLVGISVAGASTVSFGVAGALAAVAGIVSSPVYFTTWDTGLGLGLKGFVAATLGGFVSVPGAVAGGILLGVMESVVARYAGTGYKDAVAFVVLLAFLVLRPGGVFGKHAEARV